VSLDPSLVAKAMADAPNQGGRPLEGSGHVGLVLYSGSPDPGPDKYALVLGAELDRSLLDILYSKVRVSLGAGFDSGEKQADRFRYGLGLQAGLAVEAGAQRVTLGTGLDVNGETGDVTPGALLVPVELGAARWLGSRVRLAGWIRADHFLAAKRVRRDAAGDLIADEWMGGVNVVWAREKKQKGERAWRRGPMLGLTAHRTMETTVWLFQFGMGAYVPPE
jgi:hypothetical protein